MQDAQQRFKLPGIHSAIFSLVLLSIVWIRWFLGDPVSWLGLTFGAMAFASLGFLLIVPIELVLSLRGVPRAYRAQSLTRSVPLAVTLNAPLLLAWMGTYLFWAEAVSAF